MLKHSELPKMRKLLAVVPAGVLALSTAMAPMALAQDASVGEQTGSGTTEVTVQLVNEGDEHSGTDDPTNPDDDGDGLGDNIAFTVPTSINFVANASGKLTGPSLAATYIENESAFAIHGSSLLVEVESGWNIVSDATSSDAANAIDFQVGPKTDMLDAANYLTKKAVKDPTKWNMTSKKTGEGETSDRVQLKTSGDIANIDKNVKQKAKVATLRWYVTPGVAE